MPLVNEKDLERKLSVFENFRNSEMGKALLQQGNINMITTTCSEPKIRIQETMRSIKGSTQSIPFTNSGCLDNLNLEINLALEKPIVQTPYTDIPLKAKGCTKEHFPKKSKTIKRLFLKVPTTTITDKIKKPNNGIPIQGPQIQEEGVYYIGQFYKKKRSGWGKSFNTKTNEFYKGYWNFDKKEGTGILIKEEPLFKLKDQELNANNNNDQAFHFAECWYGEWNEYYHFISSVP